MLDIYQRLGAELPEKSEWDNFQGYTGLGTGYVPTRQSGITSSQKHFGLVVGPNWP